MYKANRPDNKVGWYDNDREDPSLEVIILIRHSRCRSIPSVPRSVGGGKSQVTRLLPCLMPFETMK